MKNKYYQCPDCPWKMDVKPEYPESAFQGSIEAHKRTLCPKVMTERVAEESALNQRIQLLMFKWSNEHKCCTSKSIDIAYDIIREVRKN